MKTLFTSLFARMLLFIIIVCCSTTAYLQPLRLATLSPDIVMMSSSISMALEAMDEKIAQELRRQEAYDTAIQYYNDSEWTKAVATLDNYVSLYDFPLADHEAAMLLKAKSEMNLGLYNKAFESFDNYVTEGCEDTELKSQAEFYRAVMMYHINKKVGLSYLKEVSKDHTNYYQDEAASLYYTVLNSN